MNDNRLFVCKMCGFNDVYKFGSVPHRCPECDTAFYSIRPYQEPVKNSKFVNIGYKDNPRWSESMGCPPQQVNEFRKAYPNSIYDDRGRLYIKNRPDKLRQAKERNMKELD